jgi:hypothetical protein
MRRILIENSWCKQAPKHGGGPQRRDLDDDAIAAPEENLDPLALDTALIRLAELDPRPAGVTTPSGAAAGSVSRWHFLQAGCQNDKFGRTISCLSPPRKRKIPMRSRRQPTS